MDICCLCLLLSCIMYEFYILSLLGGVLPCVSNIGMLVGGVIFGYWADKKGRIKISTYTIFILLMLTLLMALLRSIGEIYILRFVVGLGLGGEYGIGMALVLEAFCKERRGQMSLWITVGGVMGTLMLLLMLATVIPLAGWRLAFIFGVICVFLAYFGCRHLSETKSWQLAHKCGLEKSDHPRISRLSNVPKIALITVGLTIMCAI